MAAQSGGKGILGWESTGTSNVSNCERGRGSVKSPPADGEVVPAIAQIYYATGAGEAAEGLVQYTG